MRSERVAILVVLLSLFLGACGGSGTSEPDKKPVGEASGSDESRQNGAIFVDRAAQLGLDFFQFNGMSGDLHMAEITGSGGAVFDYDNDGDLDVYLIQGTMLRHGQPFEEAEVASRHPVPVSDRLYRNDLQPGRPETLRFTDVTESSGIKAFGYGMGVAVGDYDRDGWLDLYVTNYGPNQLLHNNGDGTFSDRTRMAGVEEDRWSVPTVFVDYDRDGWLDLYVGNYLVYGPENAQVCRDSVGALDYCGPSNFPPEDDRLFRNLGDGTFEEATAAAGLRTGFGPALGVVAADLTGDGWTDLYITNDAKPNNFWINNGDGTFTDEALLAGCSVNSTGKAEASMGVDAADFDGDGDLDLFMTHLISETNTLYRNDGTGMFDDHTVAAGLAAGSRLHTAFGTAWIDYDNDGWLDLMIVNGAVKKIEALAARQDPFPLHEPNQLFRSLEGKRFEDVTAKAGEVFELSEVSRGAIFGDVDNDGDTDVLIANNSGPARMMINQVGNRSSWMGLRLVSGDPAVDALGAQAELIRPELPPLWRQVRVEGSYCSANDPRLLFGLGPLESVASIRVHWPGGEVEEWSDLPLSNYSELHRGTGKLVSK